MMTTVINSFPSRRSVLDIACINAKFAISKGKCDSDMDHAVILPYQKLAQSGRACTYQPSENPASYTSQTNFELTQILAAQRCLFHLIPVSQDDGQHFGRLSCLIMSVSQDDRK